VFLLAVQSSLPRLNALPDEVPGRLAHEARKVSGAESVHIYLWDSAGNFLYGAGNAGSAPEGFHSIGFRLGEGIGYIFFRWSGELPKSRLWLRRLAHRTAEQIQRNPLPRKINLEGAEESTIAFLSSLRAKSPVTAVHCARVARYAAAMAHAIGLPESGICHVERCGLLHDIGKLGVTNDVLEKPGRLEPDEWGQMKQHPEIGVRILEPCRSLHSILPAIGMHHERFDGGGYPFGVSRVDIPIEARIVNLCDAYDTMTSDRPYRLALEPDEAHSRLRAGRGTQFDPSLVEAFTSGVFPTLSNGVLRTGLDIQLG